ncbi:MAG: TolC family protein [Planctomycetota bacterium]|jgi:outer membrane protein TolC
MKIRRKNQFNQWFKVVSQVVAITLWILQIPNVSKAQENLKLISIHEAYDLALETHEHIAIAQKEVEKSKLLPKKANTLLIPRMSINGGYTRLNDPIEFDIEIGSFTLPSIETIPEEQWLGNFNFTQPIYEGKFFPLRRLAYQALESTIEDYYQIIQKVLFQVSEAYYEVLKAKELVENAKEISNLTREELRVSKVKFKAGDVTEDVVLRSELNLTRAQSKLIKSTNGLQLAKGVLKSLIGMETLRFDVVNPPELKKYSGSYEDLVHKSFASRHDYKRALLRVDIAKSDIELVKTRFHPKIEATWDYFRIDDPAFLQDEDYWAAALRVEIPILEGGLRFLDLKEKHGSLRQAKLALNALKDNIQLEIKDGMLTELTEKSLLANLTKQVELAEKNYEIVFAKFKFGAATSVDLNEALVSLDSARTELIIKKYDYQMTLLSLKKAIGIFASNIIKDIENKR